jgi:GTP-binding protein LepA
VDVDRATLEMMELFGFSEQEILKVSAKTGLGVDELLEAIVERLPQPERQLEAPLRALVFSSQFDAHKGVVIYVRVIDGELTRTELKLMGTKTTYTPPEIGVFTPQMQSIEKLLAGEVGYIATGLKDITQAQVGDTIMTSMAPANLAPLPGYKAPQLMVFMDFYPVDGKDYPNLKVAMDKLKLNDAALAFIPTHSMALGNGLRVGFLGIFHAEIVQERLEREFNLELIATAPSVRYEVVLTSGEIIEVMSPTDLPDPTVIRKIEEPEARVLIFTPSQYLGNVFSLIENHRGVQEEMHYYGERVRLTYRIPLPELITSFYDELKSASSGFASMEYELIGYQEVEAVKLSILVNKEPVEALSQIIVREKAEEYGRNFAKKLKDVIPRQLFEIPIQAAIGGKIVARETIKAFRKDVTAKLYGGDRTRKLKLLEKQKKGKERRKQFGNVEIPQEAFMAVLKRD